MSEVEKLYKNVGIKPYIYCSKPQLDCDARENGNCKQDCEYYSGKASYPPFTAEKQLSLIKWLAKRNYGDYTSSLLINITDDRVYFSAGAKPEYYVIEVLYDSNRCTDFENALSELINNLWQDLTEEERTEIADILKG